MDPSENQEELTLSGMRVHRQSSGPSVVDTKYLVVKGCTVITLLLMVLLQVEFIYSNWSFKQRQADFELNVKSINDSALFLQRNISAFANNSLKYREEDKEKLGELTKNCSEFFSQALKTDNSELFSEKDDLFKIQKIEESQKDRKVQLDMVDANLKELYRNQRLDLFEKLGNSSDFQPIKIRSPWNLTRLNFQTPFMDAVEKKMLKIFIKNQTQRLQKDHEIHLIFQEAPICVIAPTLNNAQNYRYEYSLQSILNQNYSNYRLIIIDQGSKDRTVELIHKFMRKAGKTKDEYTLIEKHENKNQMETLAESIRFYCQAQDIVVIVQGSDELTGTKVFQLLNKKYSNKQTLVLFSNFFRGLPKSQVYTPEIAEELKNYREGERKFGNFVTFKAKLFSKIKSEDLQFEDGTWLDWRYDQAYLIPILQMSCGRTDYLNEYLYLLNQDNDQHLQHEANSTTIERIRSMSPYQCYQQPVSKT